MGNDNIFDPLHNGQPSIDHQFKLVTGDCVGNHYTCAKCGANLYTGLQWKLVNIMKTIFIYLYILFASIIRGQNSRPILTHYG